MRSLPITASVLLSLALSGPAAAAPPAPAAPPPAVLSASVEVRVIDLEVVVTDRDGQRVPGLTANDLRLLVDGKESPIPYFTEIRDGSYVGADAALETKAGEAAPTSYLVFVDEFFSVDRDKKVVLEALGKAARNLRPSDQVAVVAWAGQAIEVLSGWTSSREGMKAALETAIARPGKGLERELDRRRYDVTYRPDDLARGASRRDPFNRYNLGTQERMYASLLVGQLEGAVGAATAAMRALPVPQGRKALMLLSGGWPMDVAQYIARTWSRPVSEPSIPNGATLYGPVTETANLLGYTVYAIDVPGLQAGSLVDAGYARPRSPAVGSAEFQSELELHSSLEYLAGMTGGLALVDGMRVEALKDVGADVSSYYWIGFSPRWAGDDAHHEVRIEPRSKELTARTRQEVPDLSLETQVKRTVDSILLYGPSAGAGGLAVEVGDPVKDKGDLVVVTVRVRIPVSQVTVAKAADGYGVRLDVTMAAFDKDGGRAQAPSQVATWVLKSAPGAADFLLYETKLRARTKTERLSVAVADPATGKVLFGTIARER